MLTISFVGSALLGGKCWRWSRVFIAHVELSLTRYHRYRWIYLTSATCFSVFVSLLKQYTHKHSQKINTKVISHFSRKRYRFVIFTFSCCCCCSSLRCCARVKCVENNFKSWLIVYIYIELCLSFLMSIKNCTLACVQHFKCTHFKFFYYFFSALFFLTLSAIYIYFKFSSSRSFHSRSLAISILLSFTIC